MEEYNGKFADFSSIIANWTIDNMQDHEGHFYYQLHKHYKIRIPYMRWSQAWMMLAFNILNPGNHAK